MKKMQIAALFLLTLVLSISTIGAEQLVFAVTLIRHGDRAPTHEIKSDPHKWQVGIGELTAVGMKQHNKLGRKLRARYVEKYKLLESAYKNNSMYVRSTDFNRTIQSAESLISGLYPLGTGPMLKDGNPALPAAYQPVPLRTLPVPQDKLLLAHDAYIDTFNKMCEKYVYQDKAWKKMEAEYRDKFSEWSEVFGVKITKILDLFTIGDNLLVREMNDVKFPKGLSKKDAEDIIRLFQWIQAQQFKPPQVGDYFGSCFLEQLKLDMEKVKENKQQYKYILYSGHDSSILPVMSALRAPLAMNPPYASHVDFEMYKDGDKYFVKVRFNEKPVKLPEFPDGKCSLDDFYKIVRTSVDGKKALMQ